MSKLIPLWFSEEEVKLTLNAVADLHMDLIGGTHIESVAENIMDKLEKSLDKQKDTV